MDDDQLQIHPSEDDEFNDIDVDNRNEVESGSGEVNNETNGGQKVDGEIEEGS